MKKHSMKQTLSLILCTVLIAAMALSVTGCRGKTTPWETKTFTDGETLGQGSKEFTFVVTDAEGNRSSATILTDKTIVADALLDLELIAGEDQDMGLYVKCVNGITYDYNTDGKYWAFYIDGEYAMTGIDSTEIVPGAVYDLKAE